MFEPNRNRRVNYWRGGFNAFNGFDFLDSFVVIQEEISARRANGHMGLIGKEFLLESLLETVHHRDNQNDDRNPKRNAYDGYDADN